MQDGLVGLKRHWSKGSCLYSWGLYPWAVKECFEEYRAIYLSWPGNDHFAQKNTGTAPYRTPRVPGHSNAVHSWVSPGFLVRPCGMAPGKEPHWNPEDQGTPKTRHHPKTIIAIPHIETLNTLCFGFLGLGYHGVDRQPLYRRPAKAPTPNSPQRGRNRPQWAVGSQGSPKQGAPINPKIFFNVFKRNPERALSRPLIRSY